MAKLYFSHDYNSRNDPKMVNLHMVLGMEGIGIYWCIVEMLHENKGHIMHSECDRIAFELRIGIDVLKRILNDFKLFEKDEVNFWSNSALKRIDLRVEKSNTNAENARKRWEKSDGNATALHPQSEGYALKVNKSKVNKKKHSLLDYAGEGSGEAGKKGSNAPVPEEPEVILGEDHPIIPQIQFVDLNKDYKLDELFDIFLGSDTCRPDLFKAAMLDPKFRHDSGEPNVEEIMPWLQNFNRYLTHSVAAKTRKVTKYNTHFINWLGTQNKTLDPRDLNQIKSIKNDTESSKTSVPKFGGIPKESAGQLLNGIPKFLRDTSTANEG